MPKNSPYPNTQNTENDWETQLKNAQQAIDNSQKSDIDQNYIDDTNNISEQSPASQAQNAAQNSVFNKLINRTKAPITEHARGAISTGIIILIVIICLVFAFFRIWQGLAPLFAA